MRILLTNDDGIHAPGILVIKKALEAMGEVFTVAPERQRSASGHGMTLHKPLRIIPTRLSDGSEGYAVSGTPTDCVILGYDVIMEGRCDLVVSGINSGANLGWDLTYSGTVSAAFEGAVLNLPALALSLVLAESDSQAHYDVAAEFGIEIARQLVIDPLPPHTFLNVNVPNLPKSEIRGVVVTHQGKREYIDRVMKRFDPAGKPYYWQSGSLRETTPDTGSDVHAIMERKISVSPIHLDLTAYHVLDQVRSWTF